MSQRFIDKNEHFAAMSAKFASALQAFQRFCAGS
jgi:hypothetical protein